MKSILGELRRALVGTLLFAVLCGGAYPAAVWTVAQWAFPTQAGGRLLRSADGAVVGSEWIARPPGGPGEFHPRPSAAGTGYDAAASGGSNLGPTSERLRDRIRERIDTYRRENGLKDSEAVPADAVTASGSGLDPHISPRNAHLQVARVARARGLDEARVRAWVEACTEGPQFGFLGAARVNVLKLNQTLDSAQWPRERQ